MSIKIKERNEHHLVINSKMHPITELLLFIYLPHINIFYLIITKHVPSAKSRNKPASVLSREICPVPQFLANELMNIQLLFPI